MISGLLMIFVIVFFGCSAPVGGAGSASPVATASPALPVYAQTWPVSTGDHAGRTLRLSKTEVVPGEIITRTIEGADPKTDITSMAMMLEQFTNGSWRLISYLILGLPLANQPPADEVPAPNLSISAVGYPTRTLPALIPDVPPGSYRVRQDMSILMQSTPITLYAPLQVVSTATPSP
jgi:hypothetical protein